MLLPTKDDWDNCVVSAMTPAGNNHDTSPFVFTVTEDTAANLYFACSVGTHCASGQKVHVTVNTQTTVMLSESNDQIFGGMEVTGIGVPR